MKALLTTIFLIMSLSMQSQDRIKFMSFECSNGDTTTKAIRIGERKSLVRISASWPANETRPVTKKIENTYNLPMGDMPGGEYFFVLDYPSVIPVFAHQINYAIELIVNDTGWTSTSIRTEPSPLLEAGLDATTTADGTLFYVEGLTHTEEGEAYGFGGSSGTLCSSDQIVIITDYTSDEVLLHSDTTFCITGVATEFSSSYLYKGPDAEVCVKTRMEKIGNFPSFLLASVESECTFVWEIPTNITDIVRDNQPRISPNPTTGQEVRILGAMPSSKWNVFSASGKLVLTGSGHMIDVSLLPPSVYVVNIEGGATVRLVRQ